MSDAPADSARMQQAYARGDLRSARALARQLQSHEATRAEAEIMARRTEADPFLLLVGLLGLGVTLWLVYNYVL